MTNQSPSSGPSSDNNPQGDAPPPGAAPSSAADQAEDQCPLADTHDKYNEAHYFLEQMMVEWHRPEPFRWSMNAFLQALRNVTFYLQKQLDSEARFRDWYSTQQAQMRGDELLRKFVEGRNIVVKQRNLVVKSVANVGMFRYRKSKLGLQMPVPADLPSDYLLREHAPRLGFLDAEHSAIGEEYGVQRTWIVEELGSGNVLQLCDQAWSKIGHVLAEAHKFIGRQWTPPPPHGHDPARCNLLTETDLDPTLPEKWGWI